MLRSAFLACAVFAGSLLLTGCTERKITIESDPPGATVFVDGKRVGQTPTEVPFEFYGTREFRLEKEGYQTVRLLQPIAAPIWQYFPMDFLTDVVVPLTCTDSRLFRFTLEPVVQPSPDELLQRANAMRRRARGG